MVCKTALESSNVESYPTCRTRFETGLGLEDAYSKPIRQG